jgi:hypothetical protein
MARSSPAKDVSQAAACRSLLTWQVSRQGHPVSPPTWQVSCEADHHSLTERASELTPASRERLVYTPYTVRYIGTLVFTRKPCVQLNQLIQQSLWFTLLLTTCFTTLDTPLHESNPVTHYLT